MAGKESWRHQNGTFVFHHKVEGLDELTAISKGDAPTTSMDPPEGLETQQGCLTFFHQRQRYQRHNEMQLPVHTQQLALNKARAQVPSYSDYDQVRQEIKEDEALGYQSAPGEIQERIAAVMHARQEAEDQERQQRMERAATRPRDEKQLKAIEADASATQERLMKEAEERKRRLEKLKAEGGDSTALVHANMPGMTDQRFRNIPTPQLRERLRANGSLTVRDDRKTDGGIQQAWESPMKNYIGKTERFNAHEPRYCRHNTARFWREEIGSSAVEMDHCQGDLGEQKNIADKATQEARESLRPAEIPRREGQGRQAAVERLGRGGAT